MKLKDTELTPKEQPRAIVLGVEHPRGVAESPLFLHRDRDGEVVGGAAFGY